MVLRILDFKKDETIQVFSWWERRKCLESFRMQINLLNKPSRSYANCRKGCMQQQLESAELRTDQVWTKLHGRKPLMSVTDRLTGPFTQDEVHRLVGHDGWIANGRFPLEQTDKIRLIGDCNSSGLNNAFTSTNKRQLFNMDALVVLVLCAMKSAFQGSHAGVHLSDGQRLPTHVAAAWNGNLRLLGRTLDLESAYKQIGPKPEDTWVRVLVIYNILN